jgi:polyisoprenoid-binding protein YceI
MTVDLARKSFSVLLLFGLCATADTTGAQEQIWTIDPGESDVRIHVGKAGLFSAAGHEHEVIAPGASGTVRLDPQQIERASIELTFEAASLKVTGKGEPAEDVPEVQETMLSERVLDVARHPRISFRSSQVTVSTPSAGQLRLRVAGELTLRGVTRPVQSAVEVQMSPNRLTGKGTVIVKQTDFGIQPVTAGLGTVRVKDEVTVSYTFSARL